MRLSSALVVAVLCAPPAMATGADSSLPDKPIISQLPFGKSDCKTDAYLEGPGLCTWLQDLGEPAVPVTDPQTRLAMRMIWSVGDRGSVITLRIELQNAEFGLAQVYESTTAGVVYLRGFARLDRAEIQTVLRLEGQADIWTAPVKGGMTADEMHADGSETVLICYNRLTVSEVRPGERKTVERMCPERGDKAGMLATGLIALVRRHFPDLGRGPLWNSVLAQ